MAMAFCCAVGQLELEPPSYRRFFSTRIASRIVLTRIASSRSWSGGAIASRGEAYRAGRLRNRNAGKNYQGGEFNNRFSGYSRKEEEEDDKYFIPRLSDEDESGSSGVSDYSDEESAAEEEEGASQKELNLSTEIASTKRLLERLRTRRVEGSKCEARVVVSTRKPTDKQVASRDHGGELETKTCGNMREVGQILSKNQYSGQEAAADELKGTAKHAAVSTVPTVARQSIQYQGAKSGEELKLQDAFYSSKSFTEIGASREIVEALASLGVVRPSEIQALIFRKILKRRSCIVAEQTGSGKTLAYLAPLVQRLRDEEETGRFSTSRNPRVLILVPTSELAIQVLNVCRALSKICPLKSMVATGGFKWKTQVENLERGPDIVISTPGRFLHHLDEGTIQLKKLSSVVLDEVDILLDEEEFSDAMQKITSLAAAETQYIHVTATLPTDVHDKILQKHPDAVPVLGPSLHLTAPGLNEVLVDCSGDGEKTPEIAFENKKAELLKLVQQQPVSKTIIFCNKIETCRKVENILKRHDRSGKRFSVLPYHAAVSQETRLKNMQGFLAKSELSTFLVCTDRASRGLDSVGVEHVILFDFPRDPSEYIRRVGRTARAGGAGKVFVFVVGKQVSLARKILSRNEKRHPVHFVPGATEFH